MGSGGGDGDGDGGSEGTAAALSPDNPTPHKYDSPDPSRLGRRGGRGRNDKVEIKTPTTK